MTFTSVFDAIGVNTGGLPRGQHAGYTTGGGYIQWATSQWQHDPGAIRICQAPGGPDSTSDVLDVESGAASPSDVVAWLRRARASYVHRIRPGQRQPCVYSAGGTLSAIANAVSAAKFAFPVYLWLARPGIPLSEAEAEVLANLGGVLPQAGVQYAWPGYGLPSNGVYDESTFLTSWLTEQSGVQGDTVSIGNSGPAVLAAQKLLRAQDPLLIVAQDGLFGPATQAAVETYQRLKKLTPDGVVGPATWAALNVKPPPVKPPVKPPVPVPPKPKPPAPLPVSEPVQDLKVTAAGAHSVAFEFKAPRNLPHPTDFQVKVVKDDNGKYGETLYTRVIHYALPGTYAEQYGSLVPDTKYILIVRTLSAGHAASAWSEAPFRTAR